jgi:hypothetical protein
LGYDGTRELTYTLNLNSHSVVHHVFDTINPEDLQKLMREWGFQADLKREEGKPPLIESRTDHAAFVVVLVDESTGGSGRFRVLGLRALWRLHGKDGTSIANQINQRLGSLQASLDGDGDLVVEAQIVLRGAVTAEHVKTRLEAWRSSLGLVCGIV